MPMAKLGDKTLPELDFVSLWCHGMNGHELVSRVGCYSLVFGSLHV